VYFLNDLRFIPRIDGQRGVIRVVSSKPVREPYLNFVIEMARPNGRLMREYTLLIDPPALVPRTRQAPAALRPLASSAQLELPVVEVLPAAGLGQRYTVVRGDSLWRIARRLQEGTGGGSILPIMAELHALNPQAFVGGDINRLIAGASLLLPDRFVSPSAPASVAAPAAEPQPVPQPAPEEPAASLPAQQRADEAMLLAEQERLQLQQQMDELQARIDSVQQQVERKDVQLDELVAKLQVQGTAAALAPEAPPLPAAAVGQAPFSAPEPSQAPGFWPWLVGVAGGGIVLGWFAAVFLGRRRASADEQGVETDFKTYLAQRESGAAFALPQNRPVVSPVAHVAPAAASSAAAQVASMNLDDFALDSSWDTLSPFESKVLPKRAANQRLDEFSSDLFKMPEVFDLGDLSALDGAQAGDAGSADNLSRLNQALAFIQQGKIQSACSILNSVLDEGDDQQKQEAREILSRIA
jgi:pilus assembly protein FimV